MVRGFALAVLLLLTASPALAQRVALVIGNGAYRHVERLANPVNDARAMAASLRGVGFQVELLTDADKAGMEAAIRRFGSRADRAEAALFFYAGHAIEVGGRNLLAPVSAQVRSERDLPFELLELDLLMSQVEGRAKVLLVFLDSCRDNPFREALRGITRGGRTRGLAAPEQSATGTLVAFATAPGQVALDGRGANSPFTAALLRHLDTPGLEVRSLMGRVRQTVRVETGGRQIPWDSSSLEGEFFFRGGTAGPAAPPMAAAPPPVVSPPAPPPPVPAPAAPRLAARQEPGHARAQIVGAARLACPARGTRLAASQGAITTWQGADEGEPRLCTGINANGHTVRRILGVWDPASPGAMANAQRLDALFPPAPDRRVEITRQVGFSRVVEAWRWVPDTGAGGGAGGGLALERHIRIFTDQPYEARWRYTLDAAGGIASAAFTHIHGTPYLGNRPQDSSLSGATIEAAVDR
jgi:hypothetical protein